MASLVNATVGEYRLVDLLGAGGMGEVYRAVHTKHGRVVAIKILTQLGREHLDRFYNEARIQASLQHPAIAAYYGLHEFQGRPCLIMELVDGETLAARIRAGGPLPVEEALSVFKQVAGAVAYVHAQGVIHRDLKSNNIKITTGGQVKLLDFGIARVTRSTHLTSVGMLIGTLENLAPEQIEGAEADVLSDIWALGVLLYEMTTGQMPFTGATVVDLYRKIRTAAYPSASALNRAVPRHVDRIIARCLRKDPAERYQSAEDLLRSFEPAQPARRSLDWRWLAAPATVVVLLAILFAALWNRPNHAVPPRPKPPEVQRMVTVDVANGVAEVYRENQRVGKTPYQLLAHPGEKVEIRLHREGFRDVPVQFDVTERSSYMYTMEPARE